jgi:hypothetical protein
MMMLGERKIASIHEYTSAFSKVKQEQEKKRDREVSGYLAESVFV